MADTWTLFASGCVFGLSGGFSPGPTTTLIVSQTLRFGVFDGLKVAIAPLLTDAPIIIASVLLVEQLSRFTPVLGVITLLGACFLAFLAIESFRTREVEAAESDVEPRSISKGFMVNLLNPHPYLFWFVIGAPKLLTASQIGVTPVILFLVGLYCCLVGAKMLVAILVGRSRTFLKSRGYLYVNRALGVVLALFAVFFLRDGLRFLGVIA